MGVAYDLLYNDLSPQERDLYRATIAPHGALMYDYFAPKPGRAYAYSQNHTFIRWRSWRAVMPSMERFRSGAMVCAGARHL